MAAVPVANDDAAYYTSINTDLVVTLASNPAPLLANDFDIDGGTLTASVVASPSSGSLLSFGTNGTFTYRPNTGFQGIDTFTYKVNDGSLDSNTATVSIAIGTRLLAKQNLDNNIVDSDSGGMLTTGGLKLSEAITPDQTLVYRSDSLAKPIIAVETQLAPGGTVPTAITAQLTFNGVAGTTYSYSMSGITSGQALRFALQADGTALATGMYNYSVSIGTTISGSTTYQTFTGQQAIVNRGSSEFGANWWLAGLDRLVDSAAGALLVRGNDDTLWFKKSGSTYLHAAGDTSYGTLVKTGTTYTLTAKTGELSNFSALGLLTSRVDTNANTVSYAYGVSNELISITDPFGRVTNFNYTSSKVSSVAHFSGRTTTLTITGGNLVGYTLPDPDGAGPLAAPAFAFAYSSAGKVSSRTDAVSYTTSYSFGAGDNRLRTITHPDATTWQLVPSETVGLPTGTSGNTLKKPIDVKASVTDERSNLWKVITDRFGLVTQSTTALGFVTITQRNADGLPLIVTEPDPDGAGALSSSITKLGYNSFGDLTHLIAADGGITTATFSSTLHRQLSTTDPVGRTTSSTYDVKGNMLTSVDGAGFTTTYVVNSRGLPTSITAPDPDGAGPLTAPVTALAYDSYARLVTLTNPDTSTQTFTYNTADQRLTAVDELGKTNSWGYDSLGRQTTATNRVAATTTIVYDAMSRPTKQTDALGNATDMEYNNRGWVSKVIYADPDGAGPLTRPTDNRAYDANGNMLSQGEAAGMFTAPLTATFDADNRQISKGDPTNSSITENWYYDNAGRLIKHNRAAMSGTLPDQTVLQYDPSGRVVRQTVQSQPTMGSPQIRSEIQFVYNAAGELIAQTDGRGYTSVTTYNSRGLVATETAPDPDGACSQFGLITTHTYDNMGRETSVDRGFGRVTTLVYNNRSWVTKVTKPDPDGAGALTAPIFLLGYNLRGDQTTLTDPLGNVTTTAYDDQQRATSTTYPDPDGAGPLNSPVVSQTYNALNWVTSTTDARGGVTDFTFDSIGRVLTQTQPDPDGAGPLSSPVTTNEYSAAGLSKVTDPLGNQTNFVRDGNGRATSSTNALGGVTDVVYDTYGNMLSQTDPDPDGAGPLARPVTTYYYDSLNRVTTKTDALNKSTLYTYDVAGNMVSLKDPNNNTTNFAYDGWNRQVLDTNALSKSQSKTFDVAGNLSRTIDRNARVTQFDYDALDRQTTEKWQQSTTVPTLTISTTQEGGLLSEQQSVGWSTTAMGMSGTFTITQNGQTTAAIAWNASDATIQTALEGLSSIGAGNVLVVVTAPNTYSRTIDLTFRNAKAGVNVPQTTVTTTGLAPVFGTAAPFGTTSVTGGTFSETQAITLANATGGTWRLAYNGEITGALSPSITAAQLKTALDSFASINSVTVTGSSGSFSVTFGGTQANTDMNSMFGDAADATYGSTLHTITTVYDANDRVTSISDPSATIASTFDNLGRATGIVNTIAGLTPTVTLNQAFDAMGNRTQLTAKIGTTDDFKNTYQYDALQRFTDVVQQSQAGGNAVTSKHITQVFNAYSQRTLLSRYQSTGTTNAVASSTFTFDALNRLTGIAHKQGAANLNTYTYTFDGLSRPTSVVSTAEGTSSYSYDTISQVTGATHTGQSNETYGFDANGNRNTTGYTVGTNNQTTVGLGYTFTYDNQGSRLTRTETSTGKVQSYEWDFRNRLTAVIDRNTSGGAIVKRVDYEYDAYNRLVKRILDADGAGPNPATTQFWAYDEGINAVLQFDGAAATNLSHRYLWSDRVDELFADEQVTLPSVPGNTLWGLADNLGTLRDIADFNETTLATTVTNHRTFNANGKLVAESNAAVDLLFAFTGKQLDDSTGLQHNLFRWYDANLGQWLSEDPLGFSAGDENVRRYVGNGATMATDPLGLEPTVAESSNSLQHMYLDAGFRAGVPLSAYFDNRETYFGAATEFAGAWWSSYKDFVNPWDGNQAPVDGLDSFLAGGTIAGQVAAVGAVSALAVYGAALGAISAAPSIYLAAVNNSVLISDIMLEAASGVPSYYAAMSAGGVMSAGAALRNSDELLSGMAGAANRMLPVLDDGLNVLRNAGCFVSGTLVTISALPTYTERELEVLDDGTSIDVRRQLDSANSVAFAVVLNSPCVALGSSRQLQIPIEDVPLGARVPSKNPKSWEYDDSLPDPVREAWVKLSITVERTDGGVVDMELIRPHAWVDANSIRAGRLLPLNIAELQVGGFGHVNTIEPCPMIAGGDGSVVTGRFASRQVDAIARIEVLSADGQIETIEGTPIHPIWSHDRNDWVALGELVEGEQLLGTSGAAEVLTHVILQRSTAVYNIEVHGEHVYQVGELGLLVHNSGEGCIAFLGNNLREVNRIASGRLRGFIKGNTDLPGGTEAAKELFYVLTGVLPSGQANRQVLPSGLEILFRLHSSTGVGISKIEIIDPLLKTFEKITFR